MNVSSTPRAARRRDQRGSAMTEFVVVGPIVTLLGLAVVQYGLLFFAKNQINHASFMAARAGSVNHARITDVQFAYARALVPLHGGGRNDRELIDSQLRAVAQVATYSRIQILNPTRESFDDWNSPALQQRYGARAIPNAHLAARNPAQVGTQSGQNVQDANLLKLKFTYGYEPQVPLVGALYTRLLRTLDPGDDPAYTSLVRAGRIPVVSHATVHMQSDPIESTNDSNPTPGSGSGGTPAGPGTPPPADPPPQTCQGERCNPTLPPITPPGSGGDVPTAPCMRTEQSLPADLLFDFDRATLTTQGRAVLDQVIAEARNRTFDSVTLTGHTDPLGTATRNEQLSLQRATAVRDYLQANGFPNVPIAVRGLAARVPRVPLSQCPGPRAAQIACLAANRRVDISFEDSR